MPRFALLEHDHPRLHYDLLLEVGSVLWTWRLDQLPTVGTTAAERTFDHRPLYLDYEGPVSGGRGTVRRHDSGTYHWLAHDEGRVHVQLVGDMLWGQLRLLRLEGDAWEAVYLPE